RKRQHPARVAQHELARAGGGGAAPEPVEKLDPQLVLESADVLRDRRLRQEERLGGAREAPELGHLRKDFQAPKIHQDKPGAEGPLSGGRGRRRSSRRPMTWGRRIAPRRRSSVRTPTACA